MERNASKYGNDEAINFEGQTITWSELWSAVQICADNVAAIIDSPRQEVVSLLLPNSIEFIKSYLGIVHAGHIALPLDPAYKSLELDNIIDQVPPRLLITNGEYLDKFSPKHRQSAMLADELNRSQAVKPNLLRLGPDEQVVSLTFTSGTTGKPKAVPNTHTNHLWNIKTCSEVWNWTHSDSLLISLPLSHMHGIVIGLSGAIYHGNKLYLQRWFDETQTLESLASGKISLFTHAASAYVKLLQVAGKNYDLSRVRLCISGAAPLPPAVWQEFKKRYGIEILETYGSSETGRIAGNRLDERVLGSPGKPLPGVSVKLAGNGELLVKSDGVFPGYYLNPEATASGKTDDDYWRTGDVAEINDGYIFLKGRLQERIRRFGYTISPRDVEWALHKLEGIDDVYVLGLQSADSVDDEIVYFVQSDLSDEQIKDFCKQNLLFAWRPTQIVHLDKLPRNKSGKVQIAALKELVKNA